ncbi:MAG: hypothetical protein KDC10_06575 [Calditrichaeota bacterium]|nr:hypothetical protein [Candidatus Cloacimonadota bacterium]MCA9785289.1 hypothetical protein [Candidatus Cloacimonadota bacterium]MCB1046850.1 hypothetical protein [Calditrichota bacterium]MCB9474413.1 hypothetical protein [Candidatus Delongbacteria bacterium]
MVHPFIQAGLALCLAAAACAQSTDDLTAEVTGTRLNTQVGLGAVSIDGQIWQQISVRPEFSIGKIGVALDLTLYFDAEGSIRKEDWDEPADLLDKIYYVRWGHKGDPLYVKGGSLDDVTMGYGILVKAYSNAVEYPSVRRTGIEFDVSPGKLQIEGLLANIRELNGPGLFALRASHPVFGKLRAGATLAMDGNLYAGLRDADGDNVPDALDRYSDFNDASQQAGWRTLHDLNPDLVNGLADYPGDDWVLGPLADYSSAEETVTGIGADLGYELLPNLDVYIQWAKFIDFGNGVAPGVRWQPLHWLSAGLEYRDYGDQFIGEFFDRSYDLERTVFDGDSVLTKREALRTAVAMSGYYADARANVFNLATVFAAYTSMKPKTDTSVDDQNSLRAAAALNMAKVPKLSELSAYYQQTRVKRLFDLKTPSALHGIRLGYEMAPGVNLVMHWRTSYVDINGDGRIKGDDETVKTFLIETVFQL